MLHAPRGGLLMKLSVLFVSALLVLPVSAQDGSQRSKLKDSELEKIGSRVADWIDGLMEGDDRGTQRAHEKLVKEWEKAEKKLKGDLTKYSEDLVTVLHAAGSFKKPPTTGKGASASRKLKFQDVSSWAYRVPKSYNPKKDVLPILLIPFAEGDGKELAEEWAADPALGDQAIIVTIEFQGGESQWSGHLWRAFADVVRSFRIDHNRIHVVGDGKLAAAVTEMVCSTPHRFASLVVRNADGDPPAELTNLVPVPVLLANSSSYADKLKAVSATFDEGEQAIPKVLEWCFGKTRNATPTKLTFKPLNQHTKVAYWVRVEPEWILDKEGELDLSDPEKRPEITIEVDRAKNRITAKAKRIRHIEILLNDVLVDMDKAVELDLNGKVMEIRKRRSMQAFLNHFTRTLDRGMVFSASHATKVPELSADDGDDAKSPK